MNILILINFVISIGSYIITKQLIPGLSDMFLKANLYGIDVNKKNKPKIPEAMGVVTGCIFLVTLFIFIPIPFGHTLFKNNKFRHDEFVELIAAMLSICCMILLGFADDVLNLRWRHKLLLPTIASLPLLMVYYVNFNSTTIILPKFVRHLLGTSLDIGFLYYIFMGMLAVFCTNAINILAGINGLEVGQSLIIATSIIIFNFIEIIRDNILEKSYHQFSLYFMLPYVGTSFALWQHNKYPSNVFVGDTFCYLSGMTFAVVGILGHFSKTILLFFIPQIINFLYSIPQLFHFVPCPRHRMPKLNPDTMLLECSKTIFKFSELNILGKLFVRLFKLLHIIKWQEDISQDGNESEKIIITNNFTIINFTLMLFGPQKENRLTMILIAFQIICSLLAFSIRFPLATYFYDT